MDITQISSELKVVQAAAAEDGSVLIIGKEQNIRLPPKSAIRLRNALCQLLGTPTAEDLAKKEDIKDLALDVGGAYYDGRTGESGSVDPNRPGFAVIDTPKDPP